MHAYAQAPCRRAPDRRKAALQRPRDGVPFRAHRRTGRQAAQVRHTGADGQTLKYHIRKQRRKDTGILPPRERAHLFLPRSAARAQISAPAAPRQTGFRRFRRDRARLRVKRQKRLFREAPSAVRKRHVPAPRAGSRLPRMRQRRRGHLRCRRLFRFGGKSDSGHALKPVSPAHAGQVGQSFRTAAL